MNDRSQEAGKALRAQSRCIWGRGEGEGATAAVLVSPLATGGPLCQVLGIEVSFEGQGRSGRLMTKEDTGEMRSLLVGKELLQMSRQRQKALATRDLGQSIPGAGKTCKSPEAGASWVSLGPARSPVWLLCAK